MIGLIVCIVFSLFAAIFGAIFLAKKISDPKKKRMCLLFAALGTIVIHYSSLIYHWIGHAINSDEIVSVLKFLRSNPNLALPIYPCNMVMWCCLILSLCKKENSKHFRALVDFIFLFGIVSATAGMIANGDYFAKNVNYNHDLYKSAIAHGVMLFNILLLPLFGYFKLDALWNTVRTSIVIGIMGLLGLYCSLLELVIGDEYLPAKWNAMFIFDTPIKGLEIVRFYYVMPMFIVLLFAILTVVELFVYPKGERWFNKFKNRPNA